MEIFEKVFLGDRFIARDADFIKQNSIVKVVNCTTCIRNYFMDQSLDTFQLQVEEEIPLYADEEEELFEEEIVVPGEEQDEESKEDDETSDVTLSQLTTFTDDSKIVEEVEDDDDEPDYFDLPHGDPIKIDTAEEIDAIPVNPGDLNLKYHRVPVADSMEENIKKHFEGAFKFIQESPGATLVHCREARSRSVSVIVAYGMYAHKKTLKESYEHIAALTHNNIRINHGFQRQLMEYEKELFGISENTLNFLKKRKRFENYREVDDVKLSRADMIRKKKRQSTLTVLVKPELGQQKARQLTLFEILKIKGEKEKKKEKKKKEKSKTTQLSIMSFFKKKE